jgi:site-specific recombinase XerD
MSGRRWSLLQQMPDALRGFRCTYCTTLLRSGMDLRTVQSLMGHHGIQSTMRYLRAIDPEQLREGMDRIFG